MKRILYYVFCILSGGGLISACSAEATESPVFQVTIAGVEELNLETGIDRHEFALMTLEATKEGAAVTRFDVTLARGNQPIESVEGTEGNTLDLREFSDTAESGDRLVIDVKEMSGTELPTAGTATVVSIPIQ